MVFTVTEETFEKSLFSSKCFSRSVLWKPKYNKANKRNIKLNLETEHIHIYAVWTFTWSTVSPLGKPWKSEQMSHQNKQTRQYIPSLKNEKLKHDRWGLLPFIKDKCLTLRVNVRMMNAVISSFPMYKGGTVCVCDYANHLWLLTEIFSRISHLIAVNLLSFLIKHQIK